MKLSVRDIPSFLAVPQRCGGVLIYGPDRGQMLSHAEKIAASIVPPGQEVFNRTDLEADTLEADEARLADELGAMSLMGGRRLIVVRGADDGLTPVLKACLSHLQEDNYLIVCADELASKSSLRTLFENSKQVAALPCYKDEGMQISSIIQETFRKHNISANREIISYLSSQMGGDRQIILNELEKIIIYVGDGAALQMDELQALVEGSNERSMDDLCQATASGRIEVLARVYDRLCADGTSEVAILRSLHRYFSRLREVHTMISEGKPVDTAMKSLRPAVFFKQESIFKQHLQRWSPQKLDNVVHRLMEAERDAKLGGEIAATVCGQHLLAIAAAVR